MAEQKAMSSFIVTKNKSMQMKTDMEFIVQRALKCVHAPEHRTRHRNLTRRFFTHIKYMETPFFCRLGMT